VKNEALSVKLWLARKAAGAGPNAASAVSRRRGPAFRSQRSAREGGNEVSKYLLNKFLYTVDRDPDLVERYREDPRGTVAWWEAERANVILNVPEIERSTWLEFTDTEREALATHDFVKLFELGAHNFLTLTLFIAMFERDYDEPLGFQLEYARKLSHFSLPYPDIST
jgi:hypothetical protein